MRRFVGTLLAYALVAFVCCFGLSGCGLFGAKAPRVEVLECRARALEPVVGEVLDARELALDLYKGRASLASVLSALEATPAEIVALAQAFDACNGVKSIPAEPEGVSI